MQLDSVHDIQKVYRELLQCMARPGKIADTRETAAKADLIRECHPATFLVAQTLLDAEVTFHVLGDRAENIRRKIADYTFAAHAPAEEADYIIAPLCTSEPELLEAMQACKAGTLENPHDSALWIIESGALGEPAGRKLSGPGIKDEADAPIALSDAFVSTRNRKTQEFPAGIDLIFTDSDGGISCIPRTTAISAKEGSAWVM
ncbi:phosphonate C-P lyase system protein PhnH [Bhargavaea beijingensis]|uniref:Alpha-D-ribose 1-methylphosphonate 5-triphosphate synthase subunit PhnH n=1 Tax=Bhargavaea beijingensis TaxID=426756 RepID=A0A1G6Y1G8_9BACL|nr:phosphonate C-P lyase system protein PhnH [Bhargavaea beijingensis]MCW1927909.1 phosphonate C-P lyase system protein PhnH [Bhargavaea beijingensis]RSK25160.1 phosphonate C-P lyase system protein PhnH [Bhargavaea beijingensis]SDD83465.1 alpha-D-ribose 1-methylphosphonate 5-triphosphate synthase subunit PhnH [Bhargavaea beijingensis]